MGPAPGKGGMDDVGVNRMCPRIRPYTRTGQSLNGGAGGEWIKPEPKY